MENRSRIWSHLKNKSLIKIREVSSFPMIIKRRQTVSSVAQRLGAQLGNRKVAGSRSAKCYFKRQIWLLRRFYIDTVCHIESPTINHRQLHLYTTVECSYCQYPLKKKKMMIILNFLEKVLKTVPKPIGLICMSECWSICKNILCRVSSQYLPP